MRIIASLLFALLGVGAGHAQSPESDIGDGPATPEPEGGYLMPDAPREWLAPLDIERTHFSARLGIAMLFDYTWFDQDDASIAQVGAQEDTGEVRDFRFTARGDLHFFHDWRYQVTTQYNGFDNEPTDTADWSFTDINLNRDFAFGTLTFGKIKQTFAYEMVGDAANLPQSERLLTPFFKSRDLGARLMKTFRDDRASWAVGVYGQDATQVTARLTALPVYENEGARYLHVALSLRYTGDNHGELRYSGRPESNVTDLYLDTGGFAAKSALHTGLEALWADGAYSVLAEIVQARVSAPAFGDPTFSGWYVTGSWVVTGGNPRPYDRKVAYARRVPVPARRGEIELVARYGHVDLDDALVSGGTLDKSYLGVNWWATPRHKASLGYGNADLERANLDGNTKMLLARIQWIY